MWDLIIITTSDGRWRNLFEKECKFFSTGGYLPPHQEVIVIKDPGSNKPSSVGGPDRTECSVGSGGTVINAILVAAETLSAKKGRSMINSDDLKNSRILIIPVGRPSPEQWTLNPAHESYFIKSTSYECIKNKECISYKLDMNTRSIPEEVLDKMVWHTTPLLDAIWNSTQLATNYKKGLWVSSYDCNLTFVSNKFTPSPVSDDNLVNLFTVQLPPQEACEHGIVISNDDGLVTNIIYRPTGEDFDILHECSGLNVLSGQLYLSPVAVEKLLSLHLESPFTHCTYHATDLGLVPFAVSLYFDLLGALFHGTSKEAFLKSASKSSYNSLHYDSQQEQLRLLSRGIVWSKLSNILLYATKIPAVQFCYLKRNISDISCIEHVPSMCENIIDNELKMMNCSVQGEIIEESSFITEHKSLLIDCYIGKNWTVEIGSGTTALDLNLPDLEEKKVIDLCSGNIWQQCTIPVPENKDGRIVTNFKTLIVCLGAIDDRKKVYPEGGMLRSNLMEEITWDQLIDHLGLSIGEIWPDEITKNVFNAKIFTPDLPIEDQIERLRSFVGCGDAFNKNGRHLKLYSLSDVHKIYDLSSFEKHRQILIRKIISDEIDKIKSHSKCLNIKKYLEYCQCMNPKNLTWVFKYLHKKALTVMEEREISEQAVLVTRLVALSADVLSVQAGWRGNIRTGPSSNEHFITAFNCFEKGSILTGVESLHSAFNLLCSSENTNTDSVSSAVLTRAARHYQRAVQILIGRQILESTELYTGSLSLQSSPSDPSVPSPPGVWVEALCPARLDLAGGWTDTPPICYELGGAVLNVAIMINGTKPIRIRGRWHKPTDCSDVTCPSGNCNEGTKHSGIVCTMKSGGSYKKNDGYKQKLQLHWKTLEDFKDYANPLTPGALIKTALVYTKLIDLNGESLEEQLERSGGGWLELEIHSLLPPGSGLGGSSLIGGALLGVIATLMGKTSITPCALIHGTLALEQHMTTGGGWQDQIGGLYGGFKLGLSRAKLPTKVESFCVPVTPDFLNIVNKHLLLCYTGQVRLAKNLLQTVIRSWYSGDETLFKSFNRLANCAVEASQAIVDGDLKKLSNRICEYWQIKKTVAPESEPAKVTSLLKSLSPHLWGASLAGAGGGGYMYAILKPEGGKISVNSSPKINTQLLEEISKDNDQVSFDEVQIDMTGLVIKVNNEEIIKFEAPEKTFAEFMNEYDACNKNINV